MAIALPPGSMLKKELDEALVGITASQEWRQVEDRDSAARNSHFHNCPGASRHFAITWATARSESF